MELRLDGKVALITGGSRGIGLAIAQSYAAAGARVMITARKRDQLEEARASIEGEAACQVAHAGSAEAAGETVAATIERFGALDILVNNAATNPHAGPLIDIDLPRLDKTIEVNLRGPFVWTQTAWLAWLREHGGSVLNVASVGGMKFSGPIGAYDMTKAGLIFQTKHLASELGPAVRVNALAPGLVQTDFARYLWEGAGPQAQWPWPLQRLGQPSDISAAAVFLASDAAAWITGQVLVVDGGSLVV